MWVNGYNYDLIDKSWWFVWVHTTKKKTITSHDQLDITAEDSDEFVKLYKNLLQDVPSRVAPHNFQSSQNCLKASLAGFLHIHLAESGYPFMYLPRHFTRDILPGSTAQGDSGSFKIGNL